MTDFSSKFVVYYNVNQFNNTLVNIPAKFIVSLDYPLVNKASDYAVAILKAKMDMSAMASYVPPPRPDGKPALASATMIDKVLIQSSSISVIGSFFQNNLQSQTILDVDYPQNDKTEPFYFLPPYPQTLTLNSPMPIQVIDINIMVQFVDGSITPLLVPPDTNWTCRMAFVRRF